MNSNAPDGLASEWNPFAEEEAPPDSVRVWTAEGAVNLRVGDRIRIWPQKAADIMDLALTGKVAVIDGHRAGLRRPDSVRPGPRRRSGREFGRMRQPGHRFFFGSEEVQPYREDAT